MIKDIAHISDKTSNIKNNHINIISYIRKHISDKKIWVSIDKTTDPVPIWIAIFHTAEDYTLFKLRNTSLSHLPNQLSILSRSIGTHQYTNEPTAVFLNLNRVL